MLIALAFATEGICTVNRTLNAGIGAGALAIAITTGAGVASAVSSHPAASQHQAAVTAVNKHITRAQARRIAEAKVRGSRAIEVESDDVHDRAVWKVTLTTGHGRVVVDVDKRTGKATIARSGGHGDSAAVASLGTAGTVVTSGGRRDDHGRDDRGDDRGHGRHGRDDGGRHDRDHRDGGREQGDR
jgi:peptidase YpeB-like protein